MFENLLGRFRGIELETQNGQFVSKPGRIPLDSIFLESYAEWICFGINRVTFLEYIEFRAMAEVAQELRLPTIPKISESTCSWPHLTLQVWVPTTL